MRICAAAQRDDLASHTIVEKQSMRWLAVFLIGVSLATDAAGQSFPLRPMRIIVPYPPGAGTDFTARLIGARLHESLGQPVVVENRGGAGGIIAAETAARAAPDGYTIFFGTPAALCISPAVQPKITYDTLRDFAPISLLVVNPQILVAHSSFPGNSVAELVQLARSQPGKWSYASVGVGSPQHLGMELLKVRANVDIVHVPYKGGGPATTDVLAGRIPIFMSSMGSLLPHLKSGKLKALGLAGTARSHVFPDLPTIAETIKGYEFVGTWYGLLTQAKVSAAIVAQLAQAIHAALKIPEVRQQLISQGSDPRPMAPAEFGEFIRKDCGGWARAVKAANLKPE
jgi:tripartite-type tricarboxylate transporter receptor subunit TctC